MHTGKEDKMLSRNVVTDQGRIIMIECQPTAESLNIKRISAVDMMLTKFIFFSYFINVLSPDLVSSGSKVMIGVTDCVVGGRGWGWG